MESFHRIQNLSLSILSLGIIVSAHAVEATAINCGDEILGDGGTFELAGSITCVGPDPALTIIGNNNHILLKGFSITAGIPTPEVGILITGDGNHVAGHGTVGGFGFDEDLGSNILIENASFNHVHGLRIINAVSDGVGIIANGAMKQTTGNHIYHNSIQGAPSDGINVEGLAGGSVDGNYIYDNRIQGAKEGIEVDGRTDSSADGNYIYDNNIQGPEEEGIELEGFDGGRANGNHIYSNSIQGAGGEGIRLRNIGVGGSTDGNHVYGNSIKDSGGFGIEVVTGNLQDTGTVNKNIIIANHIIRSSGPAIGLVVGASGTIAHNQISYNIAENTLGTPVYCDSSQSFNLWQDNLSGLNLVPGTPGLC